MSPKADLAPPVVSRRLRRVGTLSRLRAEDRLSAKIDMSAAAVTARLGKVSALRRFCLALVRIGRDNGLGSAARGSDR